MSAFPCVMARNAFFCGIVMLLVCQPCFSQNDLRRGYLVNSAGDTLMGWVNFDPISVRRGEVGFRAAEAGSQELIEASAVRGFGLLDEDRFFAALGLPGDPNAGVKVFSELLLRGRANLYIFDGTFYIAKDGKIEEIGAVEQRASNQGGGRYVYSHRTYIGTLNRYFYDCLPDKLLRGDLDYGERDFVNIFKLYSECAGVEYFQYRKPDRPERSIGLYILAGHNRSSIRFHQDDLSIFGPEGNFFAGGGVSIPVGFLGPRVSFTAEPTYHRNRFAGQQEGYTPQGTVRKDYRIDLSLVKLPIGLKVNLSGKSFSPYLRAGLTALFPLRTLWTIEYRGVREAEFDIREKNAPLAFWGAFGFNQRLSRSRGVFLEFRMEKIADHIGFYGPQGATNIPSSITNRMFCAVTTFELYIRWHHPMTFAFWS